nr:hypothetical protein CFP56_60529 [Quercus suber]
MESESSIEVIREGFATVNLSRETKQRIRPPWTNVLIIKVFGKMVGFSYLQSKLHALWKPIGRINCVDLECDFFLIRFSCREDHDTARLPKLPNEYYDAEALKEIGQAIGTVLCIDTHTALETRGRYARLCGQVDVNKPLIYTILIGSFH